MSQKNQRIQAELLVHRVRKAAQQADKNHARTWEERRKTLRVVAGQRHVK